MISSEKAVYPGSFDPLHYGHLDVIKRAARVFKELTVLVATSSQKQSLIPVHRRTQLIEEVLRSDRVQQQLPQGHAIKVDTFEGLTVDYMRKTGAGVIIRGLRAVVDFEYELSMANMNRKLASEIETMLIFSSPEFYFLSSRGIKEVLQYSDQVKDLVPPQILKELKG